MIKLAFYCGYTFQDNLIRLRTVSWFSHVELVVNGVCYSSSPRDSGVRHKVMNLDDEKTWCVIDLPWLNQADVAKIIQFYEKTQGAKYDWLGVAVGQLLAAKIHRKQQYFCSEWIAEALGFDDPWRYSPQTLFNTVNELRRLYYRQGGVTHGHNARRATV